MKKTTYIIFCILGLALSATSCLKSYVAEFDQSSAERMEQFLSEIKDMLISEQYGWRMEYYVGNEEGEKGGFNSTPSCTNMALPVPIFTRARAVITNSLSPAMTRKPRASR